MNCRLRGVASAQIPPASTRVTELLKLESTSRDHLVPPCHSEPWPVGFWVALGIKTPLSVGADFSYVWPPSQWKCFFLSGISSISIYSQCFLSFHWAQMREVWLCLHSHHPLSFYWAPRRNAWLCLYSFPVRHPPSVSWCMRLFLLRDRRTSHFSLLNFVRVLSSHFSSLLRCLWMTWSISRSFQLCIICQLGEGPLFQSVYHYLSIYHEWKC